MKRKAEILKEDVRLQKLLYRVLMDTKMNRRTKQAAYYAVHAAMETLAWLMTTDNVSPSEYIELEIIKKGVK